jgi:hypothetical protein
VFLFYINKASILFFIVKPINLIFGIGIELYNKIFHQMFFGEVLQLFLGIYLEVLFIGVLSMFTPDKNRDYRFQTFSEGGFLLLCGIVLIPMAISYVLVKPLIRL